MPLFDMRVCTVVLTSLHRFYPYNKPRFSRLFDDLFTTKKFPVTPRSVGSTLVLTASLNYRVLRLIRLQ